MPLGTRGLLAAPAHGMTRIMCEHVRPHTHTVPYTRTNRCKHVAVPTSPRYQVGDAVDAPTWHQGLATPDTGTAPAARISNQRLELDDCRVWTTPIRPNSSPKRACRIDIQKMTWGRRMSRPPTSATSSAVGSVPCLCTVHNPRCLLVSPRRSDAAARGHMQEMKGSKRPAPPDATVENVRFINVRATDTDAAIVSVCQPHAIASYSAGNAMAVSSTPVHPTDGAILD
jgi:hypothetical protein